MGNVKPCKIFSHLQMESFGLHLELLGTFQASTIHAWRMENWEGLTCTCNNKTGEFPSTIFDTYYEYYYDDGSSDDDELYAMCNVEKLYLGFSNLKGSIPTCPM